MINAVLIHTYDFFTATLDPETRRTGISKGVLAAIVVPAIASAVVITAAVTFLMTRRLARNQRSLSRRRMSTKVSMKIDGVKGFKFKELASATDNFNRSTQVGQGVYGKVYKGILSDNTVVAIKRAEEGSLQGQKEFLTEIKLLSRLHHRNLVSLLGYCDEEEEQMLVYEFMPNGTLRDWLSGKAKACLNFGMRVRTALDSAKGILYLHTEANPPVFHPDIKASNILLDSKFIAKVADFGLSRLAPVLDDEGTMPTHASTIVKGTPVNVARELGLMFSIIDNRMGSCPSECIERFLALALNCCHDKTERRPSMSDVMTPETDATFSESTSVHSGSKSTSASASSSFMTRDQYFSSYILMYQAVTL
ncbi:hypothetical protein Patl1_31610 [Pistacia atlantica]|uniref:Uncharacterized protein n=1 Tax=Pistacia atlantica TaxID=434234 RepID=A0ACC1ANH5_9ROSI|nr:hypothetical protein Patl1_31610 [Pistacia atlantica]